MKIAPQNGTCKLAPDGAPVEVGCAGSTIKRLAFFSYGTPAGECGSGLERGGCAAPQNLSAFVSEVCVGRESCSVDCRGKGCTQPGCHGSCTVSAAGQPPRTHAISDPCLGTEKLVGISVECASAPTNPPTEQKHKFVYDFGQEFAGVVRITLPPNMPRGANVTIKHAEALAHEPLAKADGSVFMGNLFW